MKFAIIQKIREKIIMVKPEVVCKTGSSCVLWPTFGLTL